MNGGILKFSSMCEPSREEGEEMEKVGRGPRREGRSLSWIIQALIRATKAPWWIAAWFRCLSFVWGEGEGAHVHTFHSSIRYLAMYVHQQPLIRPWNIHISAQTSRKHDLSRPLATFLRSPHPYTFQSSFAPLYRYQEVFSFYLFDSGCRLELLSSRCEPEADI